MATRQFDRKFGENRWKELPTQPGVYLFRDAEQQVLYVGKAKNLRRRLQSYRLANRRKAHRKMRTLVREAHSLEVQCEDSARSALLPETRLLRELRPPYNVDGAYSFLYPSIGIRDRDGQTLFCFTTSVEAWADLDFEWFGSFRSRLRAKDAFDALVDLAGRLGHRELTRHLPPLPKVFGSRVAGVRRLGERRRDSLRAYLAGESMEALASLSVDLLEKPRARQEAADVQEALVRLASFYRSDARRLRQALEREGRQRAWVPQEERDALFLAGHPS